MFATFRVESLMTVNPIVLHEYQTLKGAQALLKMERIRHLPVLAREDDELVGILSQRDLFRAALEGGEGKEIKVSDVMTSDPLTVHPRDSVTDAAELMFTRKIGCLPVVDRGRVVGILTEADFVALMASNDLRARVRRAASEEG